MNKIMINLNKEYYLKEFKYHLGKLFLDIERMSKEIQEKDKEIEKLSKIRTSLARGYAKKLGVLLTKTKNKNIEKEIIKRLQ